MSWDDTLAAIHEWVVSISGLSASNVRWASQNGMRPSTTWIALQILSEKAVGPDWSDTLDAENPVSGAEIEYRTRGSRSALLSIQCFGGSAVGSASSFGVLRNVHAKARTPLNHGILVDAGIGIGNISAIQDIPSLVNTTTFEARASMTVEFFTASEVSETGTYIENTEIVGTVDP